MAYRIAAKDEEAERMATELETLRVWLVDGARTRRASARVACGALVMGVAFLLVSMLVGANDERARDARRVHPFERACGIGVASCSEREICEYDDYAFIVPTGACRRLCSHVWNNRHDADWVDDCPPGTACADDGNGTLACTIEFSIYR